MGRNLVYGASVPAWQSAGESAKNLTSDDTVSCTAWVKKRGNSVAKGDLGSCGGQGVGLECSPAAGGRRGLEFSVLEPLSTSTYYSPLYVFIPSTLERPEKTFPSKVPATIPLPTQSITTDGSGPAWIKIPQKTPHALDITTAKRENTNMIKY